MINGGPYKTGQRFGLYVLESYLGAGAFKSVYRARVQRDDAPAQLVALGFPHHQDPEGIAELQKEYAACRRLDHPNILKVYELTEHEGIAFLVMELMEGRSLRDLLKEQGSVTVEDALLCVGQLSEALGYAHAARVLHRDVKPENILLTSDGVPRLTDFGVARVLARTGDVATTRVGTVAYMAPEQINGAAGTNADLWALGVTFYELLCGRLPFMGEVGEMIQKIMSAPLDVQPLREKRVDGRIIQLIRRMLNRDPEARYQTADDLSRDLESIARRARLVDSDESRLEVLIRASFPVINVVSFEEERVDAREHDPTRDLTTQDIIDAISETHPLSKAMADRIVAMIGWAQNHARLASAAG